jgi:Lrp/AsnC family transcriptional regulator, cysteine-sensing transcriptional activator
VETLTFLAELMSRKGVFNPQNHCRRWKLPDELDRFDRKILRILQADASLSTAAIAEAVGLSASPCWRRIDRLEREGFIKRRVAILDDKKVGLNTHIFALVTLNAHGRTNLEGFSAAIRQFPEVLDCHVLMGSFDFMLRVVTSDIAAYEQFLYTKLSQLPGVQGINSMAVLSEIKSGTALPV